MDPNREQEYALSSQNHKAIVQNLTDFFNNKAYTDVSLFCREGEEIIAHKTILAAFSPFFDKLLREKSEPHPILIFNNVTREEMMVLLEFMYKGRVNVPKAILSSVLKIAKDFEVQGFEHHIRTNGIESTSSELEAKLPENSGVEPQAPVEALTPSKMKQEPEPSASNTVSPIKELKSDSEAKVINPFARHLDDSDTTICEEDLAAEAGVSKLEVISPPTTYCDSDVEIIENIHPLVVINESQPVINTNPE